MIRLVHNQSEPAPRLEGRPADELLGLATAAARGDRSATHALLVALAPHLLRTVRSVLGRSSSDVEDVAQEAALVVLRALPEFRGESSVVHYAKRTAVLVAMNARRHRSASKRGAGRAAATTDVDALDGALDDPERRLARAQLAEAVRELLSTLPAPQAEALALHCMAGCSLAEIAAASGAPLETVKSRLRLARQALRQRIERKPALMELLESEP
ncbi:MAG TPA: sigma-70 family RNA polymerase sigma factor [Polyangiaceae bacterium]|nr:sigma-70 family RNA polymerase sigma factor [Polyangiaceae bacterium]